MRYSRLCGRLAVVLFVLLCVPSMSFFAHAIDKAKDVSAAITVTSRTEDSVLAGMQWNLYRIGSRVKDGAAASGGQHIACRIEGQFEKVSAILNDLDAETMQSIAFTLENEAVTKQFVPDQSVVSDENGVVILESIPNGFYLLSGKQLIEEDTVYVPVPQLVEVSSEKQYIDIVAEIHPVARSERKYTVRVEWLNDEGFSNARGESLTVNIYKDGMLYDTVALDAAGNWQTTWFGWTDAEWRVEVPNIPAKYTAAYFSVGAEFVIQNTYHPNNYASDGAVTQSSATGTSSATGSTTKPTTKTTTTSTTAAGRSEAEAASSPETGDTRLPGIVWILSSLVSVAVGWDILRCEKGRYPKNRRGA